MYTLRTRLINHKAQFLDERLFVDYFILIHELVWDFSAPSVVKSNLFRALEHVCQGTNGFVQPKDMPSSFGAR